MRRETWILALSGMMALHGGAVPAADSATGTSSSRTTSSGSSNRGAAIPPSNGLPSRYARPSTSSGAPAAKNYYNELFEEKSAAKAPSSSLGSWADDPVASEPAPAAAEVSSKTQSRPSEAASAPTRSDNRLNVLPVSASTGKTVPGQRVIQAAYDKTPDTQEKQFIQQVRTESKTPRPATAPSVDLRAPAAAAGGATNVASSKSTADTGPVTPQVTVEWSKKGDINVGQECQVELLVKNAGTVAASQVAVDAFFPTTIRLTSAEPKPVVSSDKLTWSFDNLAAGAEHKLTVKLIPSRRGELGATANVRFTGTASASFRVEEPMLKVAVKGPAEVMLGDPASQFITVSNPGTGTAHDVKVEAKLSEGLGHGNRGEKLLMEVGSIGPGETRTVRLGLEALKGGQQTITVNATSKGEAGGQAVAQMNVIAPSLRIAVDGPALRYKGRNAKYTLTVSNDGSVANNNIRVSQVVPEGFKFVSADRSGKYDASTKSVQWFIGRLEPGQNAKVACELNAVTLGDFTHTVAVLSDSGVRAEAKVDTKVDGIASLSMELVDLDDPVETGVETMYEVRVKNDGSKAATGVSIACELPKGMELITAKAPVDAIVEGRQILFKSLAQIAPGSQAVYKIHVKGVEEGSHRMRVRMTGGSLTEPVIREEVTKVYSDEN